MKREKEKKEGQGEKEKQREGIKFKSQFRYLTAIGVTNSAVCGIFKPSLADYEELKGVPNVFLKIGEHVIDNSYLHQTEKATQKKNVKDFYAMMPGLRTKSAYIDELPSKTETPMVGKKELGEEVEAQPNYLETFCASQFNMAKHLAMVFNNQDLHAGEVVFDLVMRKFLADNFEVEVEPVEEEMSKHCWGCGLKKEGLSSCSGCQFAR